VRHALSRLVMGGDERRALGCAGEDAACGELRRRGYEILARQYRTRSGEIDIVARDGGTLVFVEVKTRRGQAFGGGAAAVTWRKQRRMALVARQFLARHGGSDRPCRFDVVVVTPGETPRIEIYTNAF
jgi:putative endonuclease